MKPIGGEIALKKTPYQSFFTDSGRSSLRLFFRSEDYRNKKVLLPDFFCGIIEQILIEEKVSYDFYTVKNDFTIDYNEINSSTFDILYVINYFGKITSLKQINLKNKILLEDNVFLIHFKNRHKAKQWFGFNSFRKTTSLSDGSLIKTNLKINQTLINPINANFVEAKVKASLIKFQFLKMKEYSEKEYLELFKKGEEEIDMQNNIYTISPKSLYLLESIHFKKLNKIAKKRFHKFEKYIIAANKNPKNYSFFTFNLNSKTDFIQKMREYNIFLPYFWQKTTKNNSLYEELVAIPLFSAYSDKEFEFLFQQIIKSIK